MSQLARKLSTSLFALILLSSSLVAASAEQPGTPTTNNQALDMETNLQDSMPVEDRPGEPDQPNPRLVIQENLQELPDVKTIERPRPRPEPDSQPAETETESLRHKLFKKSDRLMDLSRAPLTYVQENVPFFTKRNIAFFGRLELDYARFSSGILEDDSGLDLRRFRLGLAGQLKSWPGWNYKLEVDLTDEENTLSDAYVSWRTSKWGTFRIGNQKVAQTLSGQTSSVSIPFMERPLPVLAFTLKRRLGIGWDTHLKNTGANITLFGIDPNEEVGSHGGAIRAYFNPKRDEDGIIHVGASFMQLFEDGDAQLRARPESHVTDTRLVDTGVWPGVEKSNAVGLEIAGARGPVTIRSEIYQTEWNRDDDTRPKFGGWYAEASWFTNGEKAQYRDGKFIRPKIENANGAWELALRYSRLDLNDQNIEGGKEKNYAFGINWYSRTHWRIMSNLVKVNSDGDYGEQNPWIGQVRVQYYF